MSTAVVEPIAQVEVPPDSSRVSSLWALLQAELSSYPGRPLLVFRIVLACTSVMFCIIVFRIPGAALGAYYPLLISRENLRATRRSALWIATICILGTIETVLGGMLFLGSPFLHLVWVCASLGAVFYLISSLTIYEAALALGLFLTNTIMIWDQPASAEWRLSQILFTLLAILIGCGVSLGIEYLFSQTHPPDAVLGGIQQRLGLIERVLQGDLSSRSVGVKLGQELRRYSGRGTGALRELVSHAGYSFEEQQRLSTAVSLSGRLIDLAATLAEPGHSPSLQDHGRCEAIGKNVQLIRQSLSRQEIPEWIDIEGEHETQSPVLIEIERTVDLLAESLSQSIWEDGPGVHAAHMPEPRHGIFAADVLSNKEHVKFAIRGSASAIACYMFYMCVGWIGLSASIATCILTALPTTGAARHKQLMRFAGVLLGACVLGFGAQTVILPQIDSIFSYTLLFAGIVFLGAWIATSGPRMAYSGAQIVLAYELVNLSRFSINPSLVPARDTVLGIALGIGAMWLIFDHLWATSSTQSLRVLLGATIREIAELNIIPGAQPLEAENLLERKTSEVIGNFERLRNLVDVSIFEAFPRTVPDELLLQRTRSYLPQLRAALLIKTGLIHHRIVSGNDDESEIASQVQQRCSQLLAEAAHHIETAAPDLRVQMTALDRHIQHQLRSTANLVRNGELLSDLTELRLCSSLFNVVRHLTVTA